MNTAARRPLLDFRILGGFELARGGEPIELQRQPRALLAALVLRAGEVVPSGSLIESLWDGAAPASAASVLRVYISELRAVLPPDRLSTLRSGYRLHVAEGELDAQRFEEQLARGGARSPRGIHGSAARHMDAPSRPPQAVPMTEGRATSSAAASAAGRSRRAAARRRSSSLPVLPDTGSPRAAGWATTAPTRPRCGRSS
jgi:DNA-binding winged helix-turn-helix (wHTH) protein